MSGFFYLLSQIALLLAVFVVLAVLAGHYLWPSRRYPVPAGSSAQVQELERQLTASEATVQELRSTVTTVTDHKDAEMGRLESRAIQAMDSLIASHEERLSAMQELVEAARGEARLQERELEAERRHTLRLQAALVERDEVIDRLTRELEDCTGRAPGPNGRVGAAPPHLEDPTHAGPASPDPLGPGSDDHA